MVGICGLFNIHKFVWYRLNRARRGVHQGPQRTVVSGSKRANVVWCELRLHWRAHRGRGFFVVAIVVVLGLGFKSRERSIIGGGHADASHGLAEDFTRGHTD